MLLIAHRGNLYGPNSEKENQPSYVMATLIAGFDAEVDVWAEGPRWFLGHDNPTYQVTPRFLLTGGLWLHCKNYSALARLLMSPWAKKLNFFYHTNEDYVLTSRKFVWAYPGRPGGFRTICVLPEKFEDAEGFYGVCSDFVGTL